MTRFGLAEGPHQIALTMQLDKLESIVMMNCLESMVNYC